MNSNRLSSPLGRSGRKLYHNTLTVGLNRDRLEHFLCNELGLYCKDERLCKLARISFNGLSHRIRSVGLENSQEELSNAVVVLVSFLNSTQSLPACIVYETHSFLGLVKSAQRNNQAAKMHFLKALWIINGASSSTTEGEIPREQLAVVLHRLGRAYASCRHFRETEGLIQKALASYSANGVPNDHTCVVEANQILAEAKEAIAAAPSTRPKKRLSFIEEESDSGSFCKSESEVRSS
mmetsp:Transcript_14258/g.18618  ORF Transcript_14258/g.18618 Transcript_14258/m.18618 type:complete len:237 (-) Transcript_14258:1780-2490(-)